MPKPTESTTSPDYEKLVRFLITPFLEDPGSLYVNSEINKDKKKVWLRVAFDNSDRGKVFGRGGRNIQAIRNVLNTAAAAHQESIFLDIYGDERDKSESHSRRKPSGNSGKKKGASKPAPRPPKK
ncbi:MAG: hypothetical protein Tsb0014_01620 [Pleurocapsa sp.]